MNKPTKKEVFSFLNTVTGVLKSMENQYTVIDLYNEATVAGMVIYVDGFMNVDLEDVIFYDARGFEHKFDKFFVKARLIRFVHIPKHLSALELFKMNIQRPILPKKNPATFKKKRAQRYHDEIVQFAYGRTETSEEAK